jgi:hypothetical protein
MILTTPQKTALLKTSRNLNIIPDFSRNFKVFEVLNINIVGKCAAAAGGGRRQLPFIPNAIINAAIKCP